MNTSPVLLNLVIALLVLGACKATTVRSPVEDRLPDELERARSATQSGDWGTAQTLYRRYVASHPGSPAADYARIEIGRHEAEAQRCAQAYSWLDAARQSGDRALSLRASLYRVQCLATDGRHAEALDEARPLLAERFEHTERAILERAVLRASNAEPSTARTWTTLDELLASGQTTGAHRDEAIGILQGAVASMGPEDTQEALATLSRDARPWQLVAIRALNDALEARDAALSAELAESLRANGHAEDPTVQALLGRVDIWLQGTPYSVGVLLPLSGRGREIGTQILRGIELASASSGGPRLVVEDTRGDPVVATEALERLLGDGGVAAVLGPVGSATVREAATYADRMGVPVLAFSADEQIAAHGESVFRLFYSPREEVRALVRQARASGVQRFTILYPDHGYGRAIRTVYEQEVSASGGTMCASVSYQPGATSLIEPVRELLALNCEAVMLADRPNRIAVIAPTFAVEGAWSTPPGESRPSTKEQAVHFLLPSVAWSDDLIRGAGRYLQGALVAQPYLAQSTSNANAQFRADYVARHQSEPDAFVAAGYDAYQIVAEAIATGATTRRDLLKAVQTTTGRKLLTSIRGLSTERTPLAPPTVCTFTGSELIPHTP